MFGAERNIGGLVDFKGNDLFAARDPCRAGDHGPVFGAVFVRLQGNLLARFHHQVLNLIAVPLVQALKPAPGAVDPGVGGIFRTPLLLKGFDEHADILAGVPVPDQDGVAGGDDNQIFHAGGGQQGAVAAQVGALAVFGDDVADEDVVILVLVRDGPQRLPGPDIVPVHIDGHDGAVRGVLHHREIDGFRRAGLERAVIGTEEIQVRAGALDGLAAGLDHVRAQVFQSVDEGGRGKQENAAVPEVVSLGNIAFRRGGVGLFGKTVDGETAVRPVDHAALTDISVARRRAVRDDAEGHQLALPGRLQAGADGGGEGFGLADGMVRWRQQHDGIRIVAE